MNKTYIILAAVYALGYIICYWMLRVEHESEEKEYTRLDRMIAFVLALFSFVTVLLMLASTWFRKIAATGYWDKPVKGEKK